MLSRNFSSSPRLWPYAGLFVLFVSMTGVAVAWAGTGMAGKNLKTYTHSNGWSVRYPASWEAEAFDKTVLEWSTHEQGASFTVPRQLVDAGNGKMVDANPSEAIHEVIVSVEPIDFPTTDLKVLAVDLKKAATEESKAYLVTTSIKSHPTLGKVLYVHYRTKYINTVPVPKKGKTTTYHTYMFGFNGKKQVVAGFSTDKAGYHKYKKAAEALMKSFVPKSKK